uniref:Uncharacterized protein n=1 Tax=Sphaerodactylus townsendi TaxID=933632 RepID=A0ACB8EU19_9SAUR
MALRQKYMCLKQALLQNQCQLMLNQLVYDSKGISRTREHCSDCSCTGLFRLQDDENRMHPQNGKGFCEKILQGHCMGDGLFVHPPTARHYRCWWGEGTAQTRVDPTLLFQHITEQSLFIN